jgi:hypothetical protein
MARSSLTYGLVVGTALALTACGGGSSNTTGPTAAVPQAPEASEAPVTASASRPIAPRTQYRMTAFVSGTHVAARGSCVSIQADRPSDHTGCGSTVSLEGEQGTRGTVTAVPLSGYRFLGWAPGSSDCADSTKANPCSFAFDRNKTMTAMFGR